MKVQDNQRYKKVWSRAWECRSVVQHMVSMHEALSLITIRKEGRKGDWFIREVWGSSHQEAQTLNLSDKDFKTVVLNMFKNTKVNNVQKPKV